MKYRFYFPFALIFLCSCSSENDCEEVFMSEKYSPNGKHHLSAYFQVCGSGMVTTADQFILLVKVKDKGKIAKKYSEDNKDNKIARYGGAIQSFYFEWEDNNNVVISNSSQSLPDWKKSSAQEVSIKYIKYRWIPIAF